MTGLRFSLRRLLNTLALVSLPLASLLAATPIRAGDEPAPATAGKRVFVDPTRAMLGRFDELVAGARKPAQPGRCWAMAWLGGTQWPDPQAEEAVKLLCDVLGTADDMDRQQAAESLQRFARVNPTHSVKAVDPLVKAIPKVGNDGELVEIVDALGEIGPAAAPAIPSLQSLLPHSNRIIQIHAATALLRIHPGSHEALDMLLKALADDNAAYRWRAADGLRRVGPGAKSATAILRRLLKDEDVRVRVTAAGALWGIEGEVESVLPVLIRAMKEPDEPLSTKFIFPSYAGESHRVYAAGIFCEMGPRAEAAVPVLVATIREMAIDFNKIDSYRVGVGFAAMKTLGKIGPAARESLPAIREVQRAENTMFGAYPHVVAEAIARIESTGN